MGRKKRKVAVAPEGGEQPLAGGFDTADVAPAAAAAADPSSREQHQQAATASAAVAHQAAAATAAVAAEVNHEADESTKDTSTSNKAKASSSYAMTSHSGEIIQEDIYVSDGSEDDDDDYAEVVLAGSRLGIMRRGLHQPQALQQPNRQWTRATDGAAGSSEAAANKQLRLSNNNNKSEDELLDPAARAARLLQEKQLREQEAAIEARRLESETNVLKAPTLFSKRTAFDIRFDQIEEKPWERNLAPGQQASAEHLAEYFNYGLSEEEWLEYSQQQLLIRQELTDAHRQNRQPDPSIVPVQPRKSTIDENAVVEAKPQAEAADTTTSVSEEANDSGGAHDGTPSASAGPTSKPSGDDNGAQTAGASPNDEESSAVMAPQKLQAASVHVSADLGGAWGAGAAPDSYLAKLMQEQEQQQQAQSQDSNRHRASTSPTSPTRRDSLGGAGAGGGYYTGSRSEEPTQHDSSASSHYNNKHVAEPPPPPPPPEGDYYRGGRGWPQPPPAQQQHFVDQQHYDSYYPPQPPQHSYQQQQPYYGRGRGGGYRGRGGGGRGYQSQQGGGGAGGGFDPRKRSREDPRSRR